MFSMFGRTGAPTKMGPHMRTKKNFCNVPTHRNCPKVIEVINKIKILRGTGVSVLLTDRRTDRRQLTTFAYFLLTQQCSWLSVTQQKQKQTSCANIIINRLFNNSSTKSSRVALLEPKLILITITI